MKYWLLPCLLLIATSCSHGGASSNSASTPPAAPIASGPAKDSPSDKISKGKKAGKAKVTTTTDRASCRHADDQRELAVLTKDTGCEVEYTKQNEKKVIASAEHDTSRCQQVLDKVRGHLEAAGFTCN